MAPSLIGDLSDFKDFLILYLCILRAWYLDEEAECVEVRLGDNTEVGVLQDELHEDRAPGGEDHLEEGAGLRQCREEAFFQASKSWFDETCMASLEGLYSLAGQY